MRVHVPLFKIPNSSHDVFEYIHLAQEVESGGHKNAGRESEVCEGHEIVLEETD